MSNDNALQIGKGTNWSHSISAGHHDNCTLESGNICIYIYTCEETHVLQQSVVVFAKSEDIEAILQDC